MIHLTQTGINRHLKFLNRCFSLLLYLLLAIGISSCGGNAAVKSNIDATEKTAIEKTKVAQSEHSVKSKPRNVKITKPGAVAVDATARQAQLADADALSMCRKFLPSSRLPVFNKMSAPRGYGLDWRYLTINRNFRLLGASCLGGIKDACIATQEYAMDWALNSKLGRPAGAKDSGLFWNSTLTANMLLLAPMLAALGVAEQFTPLPSAKRDVLEKWIKRKVDA